MSKTTETTGAWARDEGAAIKAVLGDLAGEVVWGTRSVSPTRRLRGWHVRLRGLRGWRYLTDDFPRAMEIARNIKEAGGRL